MAFSWGRRFSTLSVVSAPSRLRILTLLFVVTIVSTIARVYLAHRYYGFQTGDDLEIAEAAFQRAVGLVHSAWDVRSLLVPDLFVAPLVYLSHEVGIRDPMTLAAIARCPFIILSGVNILLVFVLGMRWYGETAAVVASSLYAFHWIPLVYGSSLYPRTIAVTCILAAAILLSGNEGWKRAFTAGLLAALAVTTRYSEAIFFLSLLLLFRRLALVLGFLTGLFAFVGLYDRVTWGRWFGSLIEFAELTFVRRDASSAVVAQPPWWYLSNLAHWLPLALLPLVIVAARSSERRRAVALVVIPVLTLSFIFHKELRYLQVVVPFTLLMAAHGFVIWWRRPHRRRVAAVLLLAAFPLGLGRLGTASKRSTNAVDAAVWIAARQPSTVGLSQAWAYGGRLFLGNEAVITDVGIPPDLQLIRKVAPALSVLAVYSGHADEALSVACAKAGLSERAAFGGRGGRGVTLFYRPPH